MILYRYACVIKSLINDPVNMAATKWIYMIMGYLPDIHKKARVFCLLTTYPHSPQFKEI